MATAYLIIDTIDFGLRSLKTITSVEVGGSGLTSISVGAKVYDSAYSWKEKTVTKGIAYVNITGTDFLIKLLFEDHTDVRVDYINVRFKYTDKRNIRGAYGQVAKASSISD